MARLTYGELDEGARALATRLAGVTPAGERALLLYPPGLDFIAAFLGCLYAGVIAVPAPAPRRPRSLGRLAGMVRDARARVVLTTAGLAASLRRRDALPELRELPWQATDELRAGERRRLAQSFSPRPVADGEVAFLQYTSGSTAAPKGVAVTHRSRGEAVALPPRTASFAAWVEALGAWAGSEEARRELETWCALAPGRPLPRDLEGPEGAGREADAETVEVALGAELTAALVSEVPAAYRTRVDEILVAALAETLTPWTGERRLTIDLEGHGREPPADAADGAGDVSRTVGWFTSLYPVTLDLREVWEPGEVVKTVKEAMRRLPAGGVGYGVLRYLGDGESAAALGEAAGAGPEVVFNYLGRLDASFGPASRFRLAAEPCGNLRSPRARRGHLLEITAWILGGELRLAWVSNARVHRRATLEHLAAACLEALGDLIEHCRSPAAGGATPSDFPQADLDQAQLDKLLAKLGQGT